MQIDDVSVLHFGQNVYLFLYVFSGHAPARRFQAFLFDELSGIFVAGMFLQDSINRGELAAVK